MAILNSLSVRNRSILEISIEIISILFYIWFLEHHSPDAVRAIFFWAICVGFPIFCIAREQNRFPEFSLDWTSMKKSTKSIGAFTLISTVSLAIIGLAINNMRFDEFFYTRLAEYFFWAFLQQVGVQMFLTRRAQKIFKNHYAVSGLVATVFALIHFPNPPLLAFTWIGGFFWSYSFQSVPNLYTLAISHGWCAVIAYYAIPQSWIHHLKVGPTYFH